MANRRDYFFRQKITEAELDIGFALLETAEQNLDADNKIIGVLSGMVASQHSPTADLSIDLSGPGTGYDQSGQRLFFSSLQTVDVSQDESSVTTAVGTPGNEKILAVFAEFTRVLADPRIDGNSATVFFERNESIQFNVVQSAEAAIGAATPPPLRADQILLCDVTLVNAQTQVLNANISTARREDVLTQDDSALSGITNKGKKLPTALDDLAANLAQHINGTAFPQPASGVNYAGGNDWKDGVTNPAATVEAQLDKIIADLSGGTSGATKISIPNSTQQWADSTGIAPAVAHVRQFLEDMIQDLADTGAGADGAGRIGAESVAGAPSVLTVGNVGAQLAELLGHANARVLKAGDTMSGNLLPSIDGLDFGSAVARWDLFGEQVDLEAVTGKQALIVRPGSDDSLIGQYFGKVAPTKPVAIVDNAGMPVSITRRLREDWLQKDAGIWTDTGSGSSVLNSDSGIIINSPVGAGVSHTLATAARFRGREGVHMICEARFADVSPGYGEVGFSFDASNELLIRITDAAITGRFISNGVDHTVTLIGSNDNAWRFFELHWENSGATVRIRFGVDGVYTATVFDAGLLNSVPMSLRLRSFTTVGSNALHCAYVHAWEDRRAGTT